MSGVLRLTHAEAIELAGLFVLDALTPEEAAAVRQHLATCAQAHDGFADLAAVTPVLAGSSGSMAAPADLRGRVLAAVSAAPQIPDDVAGVAVAGVAVASQPGVAAPVAAPRPVMPVVAMPAPPRKPATAPVAAVNPSSSTIPPVPPTRRPWAWMSVAIVIVIGVVGLMGWNVLLQKSVSQSNERVAMLRDAIAAQGDPTAHVASLSGIGSGPAAGATGFAVFPSNGPGYIVMQGMPPVSSEQTYQAWYLANGQPTSAGLMKVGTDGLAILSGLDPVSGTDTVALTIEPAGGSQSPTLPPVVAGGLDAPTAWLVIALAE